MFRFFHRSFPWCAALCLLASCGSLPAPVLQLNVTNGDPMGTELRVSITKDGVTKSVTFSRDSTNTYTFPANGNPPMMTMAPASAMVALDLPLGTAGPVTIKASIWGAMPPAAPVMINGACLNTTIVNGVINMLSVPLMSGTITCP